MNHFFLICFLGTGADEKKLKWYASYPEEVQKRIKNIPAYQGKWKEGHKMRTFLSNFLLFFILFFLLGWFIREKHFAHNFFYLSILGQTLNMFDLFIIDLLWWRNKKRIRFEKIPEKNSIKILKSI